MTKKHFIDLADLIIYKQTTQDAFTPTQIEVLGGFLRRHGQNFNATLWIDYIHGKCGPSGGKL